MQQVSTPILGNVFKIVLMVLGSLLLLGFVVAVIGIFPAPMLGVLALIGISMALLPMLLRER